MFDLFGWLRNRVKSAVLAGVSDAVQDIAGTGDGDELSAIHNLQLQLTTGSEPVVDGKKKTGKKAG